MYMYYVQPVPERTKNKTPYPFQEEFNSWYEDRWKKKLPKYSITFFPIKIIYNLHSWKKKSFVNFGKLYINIKQTPFRCLEKKIKFKKKKYPFWQPEQIFVAESELISYSQYNTISGHGQYDFLTKFEYFPVFNYSLLNKGPEAERRQPTVLLESIRNCYLWFSCTAFSTFLNKAVQEQWLHLKTESRVFWVSGSCSVSYVASYVRIFCECIRCNVS